MALEPDAERVPARLCYTGRPPTAAEALVRRYDRRRRVGRALRILGACWGLAVVAVFLPVLHLVLVPALALGGVILALQRWNQPAAVIGARGTCPACDSAQEFRLHPAPLGEPLAHRCESCGRALSLETGTGPPGGA